MLTKTITLLAALVTASALGQDYSDIAPKSLPPSGPAAKPPASAIRAHERDQRVIVGKLRGIVFVPNASEVGHGRREGIDASRIPLLHDEAFIERVQKYLGQPLTFDRINDIQQEVSRYYIEHDRPVVSALIPEQDITSGTLRLVVVEGRLGEVRVVGNKWFKSPIFRAGVHLREGDVIYRSRLERDTRQLNANSFRTVDTVFSPGAAPGTTDLTLRVEDRFPLRPYLGYENTGTKETDYDRLFAGFNWGNVFGIDHRLNYQFTASPDFEKMLGHSGSYIAPLPWAHTLTLFGSYATTTPELPDGFELDGRTWQVSFRYTVPLPDIKEYRHEVAVGYDFKSSNNDLGFGGQSVFSTPVDISQFAATYHGSLGDKWGATMLNGELYWSPGGMGSHNNDADFEAVTPGASASYVYGKLSLQRTTRLPASFMLVNSFTSQFADGPLYASEQLGVGGYSSVRGYAEHEANGDQGFLMAHEIRTPSLHPARLIAPKLKDDLQFLAFWDYGIAHLKQPGQDVSGTYHLSSIGIGVRYAINTNLTLRADYGWQLKDTGLNDEFDSRLNIGVTVSY